MACSFEFIALLVLVVVVDYAFGCGTAGTTYGGVQKCMGHTLTDGSYDTTQFTSSGGGPVSTLSQLSCQDGASCCWNNDPSNSAVSWTTVTGTTDSSLLQQYFGTTQGPNSQFLSAFENTAGQSTDQALFYSCTVPCTSQPTSVTVRAWQCGSTTLQVCQRGTFSSSNALTNCQTIPKTNAPGPYTVQLPPSSQYTDIVFVASGFTDANGASVAMDSISVSGQICQVTTTPVTLAPTAAPTTPPPTAAPTTAAPGPTTTPKPCKAVSCNFAAGSACSYVTLHSTTSGNKFHLTNQRTGNPDTGVPGGSWYMGARVDPKQYVALQSGPINLQTARVLQFQYWKATSDLVLKACINNVNNCPWKSDVGVQISDRAWRTASIQLNTAVKRVIFVGDNSNGLDYGAVGVKSVHLLTAANKPAC